MPYQNVAYHDDLSFWFIIFASVMTPEMEEMPEKKRELMLLLLINPSTSTRIPPVPLFKYCNETRWRLEEILRRTRGIRNHLML